MCPPAPIRAVRARLRDQGWITVAALEPAEDARRRRSGSVAAICSKAARPVAVRVENRGENPDMANVAVIGAQWGDEGKGKIVDWLSPARRHGGALPGRPQCRPHAGRRQRRIQAEPAALGRGAPGQARRSSATAWWSIPGRCWPRSTRSRRRASTVTPAIAAHRRERDPDPAARTPPSTGRARRRAAPARSAPPAAASARPMRTRSAAARSAPVRPGRTARRCRPSSMHLLLHHNALLRGLGAPRSTCAPLLRPLLEIAPKVLPYAEPVWERLDEARRAGKRILFEGAQAVMLDVDHGTYPYVTSSQHRRRPGRRRARASAPARSATCSASPRPTPRGSAAARSRPN